MKKLVLLGFLVVILCVSLMACATNNSSNVADAVEGNSHSSAEDAVGAYLEALKEADVRQMLSAFAVETYVDHFDFEAQLSRIKAYMFMMDPSLPAANEFTRELNIYQRIGTITSGIKMQYLTLFAPDIAALAGQTYPLQSEDEISALALSLGNAAHMDALQELEIIEFAAPESLSEMYTAPQNQDILQRFASVWGADEVVGVAARVNIGGQNYIFCFDAARYDGKWYLVSIGGNLGALLNVPATAGGVLAQ